MQFASYAVMLRSAFGFICILSAQKSFRNFQPRRPFPLATHAFPPIRPFRNRAEKCELICGKIRRFLPAKIVFDRIWRTNKNQEGTMMNRLWIAALLAVPTLSFTQGMPENCRAPMANFMELSAIPQLLHIASDGPKIMGIVPTGNSRAREIGVRRARRLAQKLR
jgi:hypothetical protein